MDASHTEPVAPRWFVREDIDGFFGLFLSGLPDLLLIAALCPLCGLPEDLVTHRILPAIALSVISGNLFYAWQAWRLAVKTKRNDVTAIPFGVNAPTIFGYIFLIMVPVYHRTHDPTLAWHMGIFACFLSGVIQTAGAFCTDWMRRTLPPAATLGPLAGTALAYLCLGFTLQIFQQPMLAIVPTIVILTSYASRLRLPGRFPVTGFAIVVGVVLYWILERLHIQGLPEVPPLAAPIFSLPRPMNILSFVLGGGGWQYFSVVFPLALIDTLAAVQILESVRLAGDDYPTRPSLLANGLATLGASFFGSAFPTSLYFGHLSHKANGARIGYSVLNGIVVAAICLTGTIPIVLHFVPYQLVAFIIVWFGVEMIGQAFAESGRKHGPAVAMGLIPLVCAWGLQLATTCLERSGIPLADAVSRLGADVGLRGLIAISQGAFLVSMVWAAATSHLLDRRFLAAAAWFLAGSFLSFFGLIHAFVFTSSGLENNLGFGTDWPFAVSYAFAALFLAVCHLYSRQAALAHKGAPDELAPVGDALAVSEDTSATAFARVTPPS
jgi:AGZA family xanthine/uracil permease-like MFS transporter